jgi:MSHA biogenesis protein MshO
MTRQQSQQGFTLVEIIIVIVITGIIGGMVAVFLKAPIQQYMDVARRADMTDIADTALRRIGRDLRLALPNSVRVTGACGVGSCFIEFLPTTGGGRYRSGAGGTNDVLDFTAADISFEVLGPMPPAFTGGESIVVYNLGIAGASAYDNTSRTTTAVAQAGNIITIALPGKLFPFDSCQTDPLTGGVGGCRFQVITTPVTYACDGAGTLWRYWGYAIQAAQPATIATLNGLAGVQRAELATNVSSCTFTYAASVVAQRSGLVTMNLGITEANPSGGNETVTLYSATHVSNVP